MTSKEYLKELDWDSVIAEATKKNEANTIPAKAYLNRGIARCFKGTKSEDYADAINDFSEAILQVPVETPQSSEAECRCWRAYAYWLAGRCDLVIADCKHVDITENNPDNTFKVFAYELLGAVYEHTGEIREAVQAYQEALKLNLKGSNPMSFSLMERYRLACAKLNRS